MDKASARGQAAAVALNIPNTRRGVPTLVVGENVLVGSSEIPNQFPGLIIIENRGNRAFYVHQGTIFFLETPACSQIQII